MDREGPTEVTSALQEVPDLRVSTITPASVQLFQDVGAWDDIAPPRSAAFQQMQVWDEGGNGCVRYSAGNVGLPNMGYVAENRVLQAALMRRLTHFENSRLLWPASLEALTLPSYAPEAHEGRPTSSLHLSAGNTLSILEMVNCRPSTNTLAELRLADGQTFHARLVVGADGARSRTRQLADLRTFSRSYHQRGIVASVRTQQVNDTAWQRFLPTGPLALLPVRGGYSNIVWSTTVQQALALEKATPQEFAFAVNEALNGGSTPARNPLLPFSSAADFTAPPTVFPVDGTVQRSFPLTLAGSGRYVRPRLALVGDAAHVVHPLAGQGVNLGFGDVRALSAALAHAVETGRDPGELALLEEMYEQPRQRENGMMMMALDSLKHIFAPQKGLLASIRGLGLDLINGTPALKERIMKYAMG
ncbi:flavin-dependent monooxygenase [Coccomyxa subellipsoidea C-169]|uniref:Flavin-dependent monooxygenase n=1 Tax=Coccomyxa subellipsoidea (strain C-169) TaxID=574566 RepID=I0Z1W5_COCSC|nr:flavin-dependent monooxygenase [Coccomyxa subellipsoidea C-169]EIE24634.1 flavin-dependent monooxygenase [Coccomyxa subellipsoidea C-169]|eukprot:XP_005649178.1 flavin-dependent monooxygenase [Coccomyxa subellipsoidea C-169]